LQLHYGIVKAYFAQKHLHDAALQRKLNAHLLVDRWRFAGANYKITALQDFYPEKGRQTVDLPRFVALATRWAAAAVAKPLLLRPRATQ
jgi:hypothetical protein